MFLSLMLSATLPAFTGLLAAEVPVRVALLTLGNEALSFLVLAVHLAFIYRVPPDATLEWRDVARELQ